MYNIFYCMCLLGFVVFAQQLIEWELIFLFVDLFICSLLEFPLEKRGDEDVILESSVLWVHSILVKKSLACGFRLNWLNHINTVSLFMCAYLILWWAVIVCACLFLWCLLNNYNGNIWSLIVSVVQPWSFSFFFLSWSHPLIFVTTLFEISLNLLLW